MLFLFRLKVQDERIARHGEGPYDEECDSLRDYEADEQDVEEEQKMTRMRENTLTMNKMSELKRQLQNLSMSRKNKKVFQTN